MAIKEWADQKNVEAGQWVIKKAGEAGKWASKKKDEVKQSVGEWSEKRSEESAIKKKRSEELKEIKTVAKQQGKEEAEIIKKELFTEKKQKIFEEEKQKIIDKNSDIRTPQEKLIDGSKSVGDKVVGATKKLGVMYTKAKADKAAKELEKEEKGMSSRFSQPKSANFLGLNLDKGSFKNVNVNTAMVSKKSSGLSADAVGSRQLDTSKITSGKKSVYDFIGTKSPVFNMNKFVSKNRLNNTGLNNSNSFNLNKFIKSRNENPNTEKSIFNNSKSMFSSGKGTFSNEKLKKYLLK